MGICILIYYEINFDNKQEVIFLFFFQYHNKKLSIPFFKATSIAKQKEASQSKKIFLLLVFH